MNKEEIQKEIELMEAYAAMMLKRKDRHGLWDAAIDLQRLDDKLQWINDLGQSKKPTFRVGVTDLNQNPIKKDHIPDATKKVESLIYKCVTCSQGFPSMTSFNIHYCK